MTSLTAHHRLKVFEYKMMYDFCCPLLKRRFTSVPAVTQIDFLKATRRDLNGDFNDVVYVGQNLLVQREASPR
ncbi:hypothetical protein OK016_29750 [Vibrio chagasii]|nr:hypothetical protein [Vibrio chagasii]